MTDETKPITAAEMTTELIAQSNALAGKDAGLQQCLLLIAAGLFAVSAAISESKQP